MHIALTGATGFAGGPVLNAIKAQGHTVSALVRRLQPFSRNPADCTLIQGDLHTNPALEQLCEGADVLVHLAGAIAAPTRAQFMSVNVDGTQNVVEAARRQRVKRIVHVSSLAARLPLISDYAASKAEGEARIWQAPDIKCLILRPSAIYGASDRVTLPLLQAMMKSIAIVPGSASARFSLLEVSDFAAIVADAISSNQVGLLELDDTEGAHQWQDLANITRARYGTPHSIRFVPQSIAMVAGCVVGGFARVFDKQAMITPGKVRELYHPDWVASGPGWPRKNPVRLQEGLIKTLEWYVAAGWIKPPNRKAA